MAGSRLAGGRRLHIAFYSLPYAGHVSQFISLIRSLRTHGDHKVSILTSAAGMERTRRYLMDAGMHLSWVALHDGLTLDELDRLAERGMRDLGEGLDHMRACGQAQEESLLLALSSSTRPDVLVYDSLSFAGGPVAMRLGIPGLMMHCMPASLLAFSGVVPAASWHEVIVRTFAASRLDAVLGISTHVACFVRTLRVNAAAAQAISIQSFYPLDPHHPRGFPSRVHMTGPVVVSSSNSGSPESRYHAALLRWINFGEARHGSVVYVSSGSIFSPDPSQLQTLVAAFVTVVDVKRVRVLWNLRAPSHKNVSAMLKNSGHHVASASFPNAAFLLSSWLPQSAILRHPAIRATVYHCGANGLYEAIAAGLPVLCTPFAFDQPENAELVHRAGAGPLPLDPKAMRVPEVVDRLIDLLENPSYVGGARELQLQLQRSLAENGVPQLRTAIWTMLGFGSERAQKELPQQRLTDWTPSQSLLPVCAFMAGSLLLLMLATPTDKHPKAIPFIYRIVRSIRSWFVL